MSAAPLFLPRLQACAHQPDPIPILVPRVALEAAAGPPRPHSRPAAELAFYRKYTEGMLRRYVSMSMEAGRVPSLLGKEIFPGNVTSYQVRSFEDNCIFIHDMESCINRLDTDQQWLIRRIALQQFTQEEAAQMLQFTRRTIMRKYNDAMNRLTGILLEVRLLEPFSCS
ncbi:putative DNA-binding protein (UPF0251 family) [Granulicella aggregans]|uniref:Putative DNA-binding protein (UPF0251 family) n=1 Tax=Granulicella aggregans TaxID=474949 RepID=A0A7W7ZC77_9BACT|nr:hypothetical protein [Granulicella aggregans]MBB5057225.1 putative DNA-binding protein (UPF0251 family) [Granulicella aggregans]